MPRRDDNQGRPIYQPLVVNQDGRHILYNGNLSGDVQNPLTGQVEPNGTSIIDVSDVAPPKFLFHIPGPPGPVAQAGAQMVRVCSGSVLPHGEKGRWYLLRAYGNVGTDESQQLWDVTNPAKPSLLTTIVGGLSNTHKNWWECDTGIAYLVAGSASDGWHQSGSKQHLKIYDLSDSQPSSTTSRDAGQALSQVSSTRHWNAVDIGLAIIVPSISWRAVDCTLSLANMLSRVTMSAVTAVLQTDSARGERRVRLGSLTNDAAPIAHR